MNDAGGKERLMNRIPDFFNFSREDSSCFLPFGGWTETVLDLFAKWGADIYTCEKEVMDYLEGKTLATFYPPPDYQKSKRKKNAYRIGFFGNLGNPFEEKTVQRFTFFLKEKDLSSFWIGGSGDVKNALACQGVFPIQENPALTPLMMSCLYAGVPLFLPESSRSFFPSELPVYYYTQENWNEVLEKALAEEEISGDLSKNDCLKAASNYFKTLERENAHQVSNKNYLSISDEDWATFLFLQEKFQESLDLFTQLGEKLSPVGWNNFGVLLSRLERYDEAKDNFEKAGSGIGLFNLAQLQFREKSLEKAKEAFDKFLESSEKIEGLILSSSAPAEAVRLHKIPSWSSERQRVLKATALHQSAVILWELEKKGEAIQTLKEAISLDPKNPYFLQKLALLNIERGMVAQPIKLLNEAIKLFPFYFEGIHFLAVFYCRIELYDQVFPLLENALKFSKHVNPFRVKMYNLLAYAAYQQGDPDRALEFFNASLKEDKNQPDLRRQLSIVYLNKGVKAYQEDDFEDTLKWAKKSLSQDPEQAYAMNLQGAVSYQKGELGKAEKLFENALSYLPGLSQASKNLKEIGEARKVLVSIILLSHEEKSSSMICVNLLQQFNDLPYEMIYLRNKNGQYFDFLGKIPRLAQIEGDFKGAAQAYNYGASKAQGKYLVFMEDDVLVSQNWLSTLIGLLELEDTGMAGPATDFCGSQEQIMAVKFHDPIEVESLDQFCLAVKRKTFLEIGGFDENFKIRGFEDRDLSLRIKLSGKKLLCHPGAFVRHTGLMPVLPENVNLKEIDHFNASYFKEKWEAVKARV